ASTSGVAGTGEIALRRSFGLSGDWCQRSGSAVLSWVERLRSRSRRAVGVIDGATLGRQGVAAVDDQSTESEQGHDDDDDEPSDLTVLVVLAPHPPLR